jgi:ATP-dependent Clp protease ATP-binding subunit ClpA
MMIISASGLRLDVFDAVLASVLGHQKGEEGFRILAEAQQHGHAIVELQDWLYCLVRATGTRANRFFAVRQGKTPDHFIDGLEKGLENTGSGLPPMEVTTATVAPDVLAMLDKAENLARENGRVRVNDEVLTLAILEAASPEMQELLEAWATPGALQAFLAELRRLVRPPEHRAHLFTPQGLLDPAVFSPSGKRVCRRLEEDVASLGATKATTRHLLYTLLGSDASLLAQALAVSGLDVKRDLHAVLSRELVQTRGTRTEGLILSRDTLFGSVVAILEEAEKLAAERGASQVGESDVVLAFVRKQPRELTRLFPAGAGVELSAVEEYVVENLPEPEHETPLQRYSIKEIEQRINSVIFGQSTAMAKVIPWIKRLRFGIPRDYRPAAVFLFLGPSGTGKTQMAKELARYVYGSEERLIFLEMGQFKTKESMNTFVGAPPGYVGYGEGKLTNGLRDQPECVVLFDEIEKADTQVFDTILRFADEGVISDPAGPVRDGHKCIIVMTTNAGQSWLRSSLRTNPQAQEEPEVLSRGLFDAAMKELESRGFRPEFLARVDERICFLPLTRPVCRQIVDSIIEKETAKFRNHKRVDIEISETVRELLADVGYRRTNEEGARGVPRIVNELIVAPATDLLAPFEEEGRSLPARLIAERRGLTEVVVAVKR